MPTVHFLNVSPGDCTLIQHASGRVSMIDICDGNTEESLLEKLAAASEVGRRTGGNFGMCEHPTNPIEYAKGLGVTRVFRFVLSHPDMDHMDGFDALLNRVGISNFWDSGARKSGRPDFGGSPYREEDWDRYVRVRGGAEQGVTSLRKQEGARFAYANQAQDGSAGGDGLHILAPDAELINDSNEDDDLNDASYVLLYRSAGGRIVLPGDAHDASWSHVLRQSENKIRNSSVLLAPHHGRDSDRSCDFLDVVKPKLTWIGCCPSEYIDYDQWRRRGLRYITSNQSGNVVLECASDVIDVYVENIAFAEACGADGTVKNKQGYAFVRRIVATPA
jgi:competence protein ComEC